MPVRNILQGAAVALATLGIAFPQTRILASEQRSPSKQPKIQIAAPNTVFDVRLSNDDEFTGRVVDHQGSPIVGANVVVRQGKTIAGQAVTTEQGNFSVKGLKSGLYEVHSGATVGNYRMWSEKSAPPSAKPHGLLVLGANGARGQYGLTETIVGENLGLILLASTTGLALAALIIAIHADHVSKEAKDIANHAFHSP